MGDRAEFVFCELGAVQQFQLSVFEACLWGVGVVVKFQKSVFNYYFHVWFVCESEGVGRGIGLGFRFRSAFEFYDCVDVAFAIDYGVEFCQWAIK